MGTWSTSTTQEVEQVDLQTIWIPRAQETEDHAPCEEEMKLEMLEEK
jgi:hypothetical protein